MSGPCAPAPCRETGSVALERTRYYVRQLVTPDDFTQDQLYFRERLKRHNRMLHGWGIVCGACVRPRTVRGTEVVVEPGYILGPYGDEIVIDREVILDLRRMGGTELDGCCEEQLDPWCGDVRARCPEGDVYLAVRYQECEARPVRATSAPCGCGNGGAECQYSRLRDSYAFTLLRELPSSYAAPKPPSLSPCGPGGRALPCPPCPDAPWVILAAVRTDAQCLVGPIDCFRYRRYVQSYANFYQTCRSLQVTPGVITRVAEHFVGQPVTESALTMMDERAAVEGAQPTAFVAVKRADGRPMIVPGAFPVAEGETLREVLAREGDRTLMDPGTGARVRLRTIFEQAKAPMGRKVANTAAALSLLEGMTVEVGGAAATTVGGATAPAEPAAPPAPAGPVPAGEPGAGEAEEALAERIRHDPAAALEIPIGDLPGAANDLGEAVMKRVGRMTLGEVADLDRDAFAKRAATGLRARERDKARAVAGEIWRVARETRERIGG